MWWKRETRPPRPVLKSLLRGLRKRCPRCGEGRVLSGYLKVVPYCSHCGERLGHITADDGPAYFTILVVGHIMVPLFLAVEQAAHPPLAWMLLAGLPLTLLLTMLLLPMIKGAVVGFMWAHRLKGDEHADQHHHPHHDH